MPFYLSKFWFFRKMLWRKDNNSSTWHGNFQVKCLLYMVKQKDLNLTATKKGFLFTLDSNKERFPVYTWHCVQQRKVSCLHLTATKKGFLFTLDSNKERFPVYTWQQQQKVSCLHLTATKKGFLFTLDSNKGKCH